MPRFKQIGEIQQLMSKKKQIRNLGIVAHIDHGKTTLADSLLAGAGLLSPQMAGSARVLDYLDEEQKRKITIKTANISLVYKSGQEKFLINLVDTPGHVDFTGKVTRALRAIDGVVVLVDAVEGIMAQTEIVTKQALSERVCPVLFINKVDRLITELQLSSDQIEKRLNQIISSFNDLLELYCEEQFKDEWKVAPEKGNVAFGSALHGWGFTLEMARTKKLKFTDIINSYLKSNYGYLKKTFPAHAAIFEMAAKSLPNPKQAQPYRVEKIWSGAVFSRVGKAIAECSDDQLTVMCATNVQQSSDGSSVAIGRMFSGKVKEGDKLYCVNTQRETVVNKVYIYMGSFKEPVPEVSAGNIVALEVIGALAPGETLVDSEHKSGMVPFESIIYVSEPVMTVAIEPKDPKDMFAMLKALNKLVVDDPNLAFSVDKETGENLLSVMGELHLEVALNQLKSLNKGLLLTVSPPRVAYREGVSKAGSKATAYSPNRQNKITIQVMPEEEEQTKPNGNLCLDEETNVLSIDEQRNVLLDCTEATEKTSQETLASIIGGFEFSCSAGPLCGEPLKHVRVNLLDLQVSQDPEKANSEEIMHGVGKAIFGSMLTAKPVLFEPVFKTVISVPTDIAGECSRIVETRRGKIRLFEQKGLLTILTGFIPVSETFGLSKELRSATSGKAFWQNIFDHWEKVPERIAEKVITETRKRKGLSPEIPSASKFLETNQA